MSLITSVIGGIMGGHAQGVAANDVSGADKQAAGTVQSAAAAGNAGIQNATTAGQGQVLQAGQTAGQGMTLASLLASLGVNQATSAGQSGVTGAAGTGIQGLNPYYTARTQAACTHASSQAPGCTLAQTFNPANLANTPGYQFQLQQGQQALQRQQAAVGAASGGGAMKQM